MDTWLKFETTLAHYGDSKLWGCYYDVPVEIALKYIQDKDRRVLCKINGAPYLHCALMPNKGRYFVLLNKPYIKSHKLSIGQKVTISITKDHSKYGMDVADEFQEVLNQDPVFETYFEKLTPGKQRNLLHLVNSVKSSEIRIRKSLVIADHLVVNKGEIHFKLLYEAL
jgi:Bacteriocin-protection, YdeI or OmpD-Associated/Domain of unknown function (DUF1905)